MDAQLLALSILIMLLSVILHEVAHGYVAMLFGDYTAERAGRLTLNPISHIDPIGTILLPTILLLSGSPILLGWAKPVPVNPLNFSDIRKGELFVSAAGIGTNLLLAVIGAVVYHTAGQISPLIQELSLFMININLLLAVFNLVPIPPLDGSKVIMSQLPYNLARVYERLEPFGFVIIILLWYIPFGDSTVLGSFLSFITGFLKILLGV